MSSRNILFCDDTIAGERGDGGGAGEREKYVCVGGEKQRDGPTYGGGMERDESLPGP